MDTSLIHITSFNSDGTQTLIETETNKHSSLMELLVAEGYPVAATCGGMALCGTCCIDILESNASLTEAEEDEITMLDSLPSSTDISRLSCQLKLSKTLNGLIFRLNAED